MKRIQYNALCAGTLLASTALSPRVLAELESRGMLDNTLIVVTSDNGMPFPTSGISTNR